MNTTDPHKPLIDVETLQSMPPEGVLIVDCRFDLSDPEKGRRDFLAAHIPGAVYAHLDEDLSEMGKLGSGRGRHPLPEPPVFAASLGRWGWAPELTLIAYDAGGSAMVAARLWWLMRQAGLAARVLDGGLAAWKAARLPLQHGNAQRTPTRVSVQFDTAQVVSTEQLQTHLQDGDIVLLDARAGERYRGEVEPLDRAAGHVPSARNRPFVGNLQDDLHFKPAQTLRTEFGDVLGACDPAHVVHMCGSGVTACHNLLAMEQAGLHGSRLYAPSWSGWSSDPARPVAIGSEPG